MNIELKLDFRLLGLIGSISLIISQFLSWFSGLSLMEIYLITTQVAIEDSFLYLFPLISGCICLIGVLLIYFKQDYRINSIIINYVGFAFFLIFIFELVPQEIEYFPNAGIGFYISIIGCILIFFHNLHVLLTRRKSKEGS